MKHALILSITIALGATACDKPKEIPAADAPETAAQAAEPKDSPAEEPAAEAAAPKVEVAAKGGALEPPVKPEQLPDGAWYCDMGTVHWAGMEKPEDGKCPTCGMALKEFASADHAAQKAKAVEAAPEDHAHDDEHGHEHGEHGHEH